MSNLTQAPVLRGRGRHAAFLDRVRHLQRALARSTADEARGAPSTVPRAGTAPVPSAPAARGRPARGD